MTAPNLNAFAADGSAVPVAVVGPDPAFVNGTDDTGYATSFGWAADGKPDPDRLVKRTRVDRRAILRDVFGWWRKYAADTDARHSVEKVDADGMTERKGGSGKPVADNPRRTPPPESRLTQLMSPHRYSFERPFDQTIARQFNGQHFSMANNRRTFEIGGMGPVNPARNTYRIEPKPWDTDIVELPPEADYVPNGRYASPGITTADQPTRAWRLG